MRDVPQGVAARRGIIGERDRGTMRWRLVAFLLTAVGAGVLFGYGWFREELGEVMFNAAML